MNPTFETVSVSVENSVGWLRLNRPERANAFDMRMWNELPMAAKWLNNQPEVRVVVLRGEGRHFCSGIDISVVTEMEKLVTAPGCAGRARESVIAFIELAQASFTALEELRVPVIAAIHGACIGGGIDLAAACDIRLAATGSTFCIKEIDLAIVPDAGTVQRLRHVIGYSNLVELTYTAESFGADSAPEQGVVSRVLASPEALFETATEMAANIAAKSPLAVRGIKRHLLWSREHSVRDGLSYVAAWNGNMLISDDTIEAIAAQSQKRQATYRD